MPPKQHKKAALPYDGDVQAAMRAEDREAIRVIMAQREAVPVEEATSEKKGKKKWWWKLKDADPISLEPLSELEYPPFECGVHFFDGRVLAFYIVSTGTFANPMSRDELTLDDCERLDQYLKRNKLDAARVADAYRLQALIKNNATAREASGEAAAQRRHATAVLHSLFGFARYGDTGRTLREGLTEEDEDQKEEEEQFPALLSDDAEHAQATQAAHQANWARATRLVTTSDDDFPALPGGSTPPPRANTAPAFRNAVTSYAVTLHEQRDDAALAYYSQQAMAVADDFPPLPPSVVAEQYRALALAQGKAKKKTQRKKKEGGSIVARIRDEAGEQALAKLREKSLEYRRGDVDAPAFYAAAVALLPADSFDELFGGLVALIPDVDARREMQLLILGRRNPPSPPQPPPQQPPPREEQPPAGPPPSKQKKPTGPLTQDAFPKLASSSSSSERAAAPKPTKPRTAPAPSWGAALKQYDKKATPGPPKKTGLSVVVPRKK